MNRENRDELYGDVSQISEDLIYHWCVDNAAQELGFALARAEGNSLEYLYEWGLHFADKVEFYKEIRCMWAIRDQTYLMCPSICFIDIELRNLNILYLTAQESKIPGKTQFLVKESRKNIV